MDLSRYSDEELEQIISTGQLPNGMPVRGPMYDGPRELGGTGAVSMPAAPPEDPNRMGMSSPQLALAGLGGSLYGMGVGAARAGAALADQIPGVDASQARQKLASEAQGVGQTMKQLRQTTPGAIGSVAGDVAVGAALPISRGTSVIRNAARTAAVEAPVGGLQAAGEGADPMEGAVAAGVGGSAASSIWDLGAKTINRVRGKWGAPDKKYLYDFAKQKGVDLRTGDLYANPLVRKMESAADWMGTGKLDVQVDELEQALFGEGNKIAEGIGRAQKIIGDENQRLWAPVYAAASQGTTSVRPLGVYNSLSNILNKYPQALNSIENQEIRRLLEGIATSGGGKKLPPLSFQQARELQQAIGPELAAMKLRAANGTITRGQVNAISDLYKSVAQDLQRWGNHGNNQKAYDLYKRTNEEFKRSFLPFMENDIVVKMQKGMYEGHNEAMVHDLLKPLGKTQRDQLLWYLAKTDHDAAGYVQTLLAADRAGKALKGEMPEHSGLALGSTLFAPKAMAATLPARFSSNLLPYYAASREIGPEVAERGVKGGLGLAFADLQQGRF